MKLGHKDPIRLGIGPHSSYIMVSWIHLNPHPKRHLDRFSRFWTAHGRESL